MDQSHTWLHVDVRRPMARLKNWAIEAGTPNVLFRAGHKDSLLPYRGLIEGYQAKTGRPANDGT